MSTARAALLAGPTALAFFSGGYFDEARAWAGIVAWVLLVVAVLLEPNAFPRGRYAWLAVGGLALLGGWTLLSMIWAPLRGGAYHAGQIVMLYAGALLASAILLRGRAAVRWVEPALCAGAMIVIGYGVSERMLPGLLHFAHSETAAGRLEQPLTYWNAMGELAALGLILAARIAGDVTRPRALRAIGAGAAPLLSLGLYLSFSRGALFAAVAGVVALIVAAPRREQLQALVVTLIAGGLAAAAAAPFAGVTTLAGALGTRERQGAITLALVVLITAATALVQWLLTRRERSAAIRLPRRASLIALVVICAGLAIAIVVGGRETSRSANLASGASRLTTLSSDRYAYWRVAFKAFAAEPLRGIGAGGWSVWWLRYRRIDSFSQDAHSLPIQTLAELGIVGLALLAVFLAGIALAGRAAFRNAPGLAAGPIAGLVVYVAHAPLDWDWQMPAVTLVAIVLGGVVLGLAERPEDEIADVWVQDGRAAASVPAPAPQRVAP